MCIHSHGRKFGQRIETIDPYWSVGKSRYTTLGYGGDEVGKVVDGRFYLSKNNLADSEVVEYFSKYGVIYNLFIHPLYGSEGKVMFEEKTEFSFFKFDSTNLGNVKEAWVEIEFK